MNEIKQNLNTDKHASKDQSHQLVQQILSSGDASMNVDELYVDQLQHPHRVDFDLTEFDDRDPKKHKSFYELAKRQPGVILILWRNIIDLPNVLMNSITANTNLLYSQIESPNVLFVSISDLYMHLFEWDPELRTKSKNDTTVVRYMASVIGDSKAWMASNFKPNKY